MVPRLSWALQRTGRRVLLVIVFVISLVWFVNFRCSTPSRVEPESAGLQQELKRVTSELVEARRQLDLYAAASSKKHTPAPTSLGTFPDPTASPSESRTVEPSMAPSAPSAIASNKSDESPTGHRAAIVADAMRAALDFAAGHEEISAFAVEAEVDGSFSPDDDQQAKLERTINAWIEQSESCADEDDVCREKLKKYVERSYWIDACNYKEMRGIRVQEQLELSEAAYRAQKSPWALPNTQQHNLQGMLANVTDVLKEWLPGIRIPGRSNCWQTPQGPDPTSVRCTPKLYIPGVQKCGTSDVRMRLNEHPDVIYRRNSFLPYLPWDYPMKRSVDWDAAERYFGGLSESSEELSGTLIISHDGNQDLFSTTLMQGCPQVHPATFCLYPEVLQVIDPESKFLIMVREPASRLR